MFAEAAIKVINPEWGNACRLGGRGVSEVVTNRAWIDAGVTIDKCPVDLRNYAQAHFDSIMSMDNKKTQAPIKEFTVNIKVTMDEHGKGRVYCPEWRYEAPVRNVAEDVKKLLLEVIEKHFEPEAVEADALPSESSVTKTAKAK
jgi:hypothetical protein